MCPGKTFDFMTVMRISYFTHPDLQEKHRTSCEALGNLCTVQMYKDERKVNPCKVFKDYRRIPTSSDADRLPLPWIYYGEGDATIVLNKKKITSKYSIKPDRGVSMLFVYFMV